MIRIHRVSSTALPFERNQVEQVQRIFRASYPEVAAYADGIPTMLDQPVRQGYRSLLLVSQASGQRVTGFSLFFHFYEINSSFLDFLVVDPTIKGGGIGSALYEATREVLSGSNSRGLYCEVMPDDPRLVTDQAKLEENRRRLKFYERYSARPIAGTEYATPIDEDPAPYLVFDGLGRPEPLGRSECRAAVRILLSRKYGHLLKPEYIEQVVESIIEDPVRLRPPKYTRVEVSAAPSHALTEKPLAVVWSAEHVIHHVRERGYVERPARIDALLTTLRGTGPLDEVPPRVHAEKLIREVHDGDFVSYLKNVCRNLEPGHPVYPYVFPIRRPERRPRDLATRAGYYCIDTFTPLDRGAYQAARSAVDVALTASEAVLQGRSPVYALCRPPGHHAERRVFGGFCYFNNAAIAAQRLCAEGRVAMLDIDFHHGNGQQDIFWRRDEVLTISIHGHPRFAYPYFSGFADETGDGPGRGCNRNFPLGEKAGAEEFFGALERALELAVRFGPLVLVVCVGYDTMAGDPTGSFGLRAPDMQRVGRILAGVGLPLLLVQEGGYTLRNLRAGSAALVQGVLDRTARA